MIINMYSGIFIACIFLDKKILTIYINNFYVNFWGN